MKRILHLLLCTLCLKLAAYGQSFQSISLNGMDSISGHYLVMEPAGYNPGDSVRGVLVLLAGFSQHPEHIFPETKLPNVAFINGYLTVCFAAGYKLYADPATQAAMTAVFKDVLKRYPVRPNHFVLGGYSAGGNIALRYTELCNQYPNRFPIKPAAVFMVDAPIDVFTIWEMMSQTLADNYSAPAVNEAREALRIMKAQYGVPKVHVAAWAAVNSFSMNKAYGDNEKYLKNTPLRTYHDVDVVWRLTQRHQSVHNSNYEVSSELIYRLMLLGNTRAEFIQATGKGYRSNGMRHPHSWSIVDEAECIQWISTLL